MSHKEIHDAPSELQQERGLQEEIERHFAGGLSVKGSADAQLAFERLRDGLERGTIRAAEPVGSGWRTNEWVKRGILLGFRLGEIKELGNECETLTFVDKATFPARRFTVQDGVRIVVGGSSVRRGAYLAPGVICVPPMYVNVGAYVDEGALVDSHALIGSCAQIGKRVHVSAAAQIGGVLEPVNASPVIVEDDVLVGGNCGVYEGTLVRRRAVLASGVILTRSTPVYDIVREQIYRASGEQPLEIPEGAVVVPGSRPAGRGARDAKNAAAEWGISLYTPVIVKYRDEKTDAAVALEQALR